jgi:hypothetical protein
MAITIVETVPVLEIMVQAKSTTIMSMERDVLTITIIIMTSTLMIQILTMAITMITPMMIMNVMLMITKTKSTTITSMKTTPLAT